MLCCDIILTYEDNMISYSTRTAATALGIEEKSLDNILSREAFWLERGGRQGVSRRLTFESLFHLAVAFILKRELGVPLSRGLELAIGIAGAPLGAVPVGSIGTLQIDTTSLRSTLTRSLAAALEDASTPPRGRPARRTARNEERGAS